jgi:hypothetical protein
MSICFQKLTLYLTENHLLKHKKNQRFNSLTFSKRYFKTMLF